MEKTYEPRSIEQRWYDIWEQHGYFAPHGVGESYCIMIPPPNVTGTLHMGHAIPCKSHLISPEFEGIKTLH